MKVVTMITATVTIESPLGSVQQATFSEWLKGEEALSQAANRRASELFPGQPFKVDRIQAIVSKMSEIGNQTEMARFWV